LKEPSILKLNSVERKTFLTIAAKLLEGKPWQPWKHTQQKSASINVIGKIMTHLSHRNGYQIDFHKSELKEFHLRAP